MSLEQWESLPQSQAWGPWSHTDHLLAKVADRLAYLQWTIVAVNTTKGQPPKPPEPLPRPGIGAGPLGAAADSDRRKAIRSVAVLRAKERAQGAMPSEEQISAVMDELMGGDDV